jgi:hypothetical protein
MNAFQQCLDTKPPDPVGFPTGRSIASTCQIASHLCNGFPESPRRHPCGRLTSLSSNNGEQIGFEDGVRRALRSLSGKISQLGASAQPGETTSPSLRIKRSALCTWRSSRRHPVLRRLQIVLHERAVLIPSHSLGIPAQGSSWGPRSPESIPRALLQQASALPTPEWPILPAVLC